MKRSYIVLIGLAAAVFAVAAKNPDYQQAVVKLRSDVAQGWINRSADAMVLLWDEDGEIVDVTGERAVGKANDGQFPANHLGKTGDDSRLNLQVRKIDRPRPGVITVEADYEFTRMRELGGQSLSGIYVVTLREKGGKWRVVSAKPKPGAPTRRGSQPPRQGEPGDGTKVR